MLTSECLIASKKTATSILLFVVFTGLAVAQSWRPVSFSSLTEVEYESRPLLGWQTTSEVIFRTLQEGYPKIQKSEVQRNSDESDVAKFFSKLGKNEVEIVYLGVRQTEDGLWEIVSGKKVDPGNFILEESSQRIVILDACHAEKIHVRRDVWKKFAAMTLFASRGDELTYQLNTSCPQPVDIPKRYPQAYGWLQREMPEDWNKRISFLGLAWLEAWLKKEKPPETKEDWVQFFKFVQEQARRFAEHHAELASEIILRD